MGTGVLVDANVLFSKTLRAWLFLLRHETQGQMYTVLATEDIIAETVYRYRRAHQTAPGGAITSLHDLVRSFTLRRNSCSTGWTATARPTWLGC